MSSIFFWNNFIYLFFILFALSYVKYGSVVSERINDSETPYSVYGMGPKNPYYHRKYLNLKNKKKFGRNVDEFKFNISMNDIPFMEEKRDSCPFKDRCSREEARSLFSEYYCFDFDSTNVTDIFKDCSNLAMFLKLKEETPLNESEDAQDKEKTSMANEDRKKESLPNEKWNIFENFFFRSCSWTNKYNKKSDLQSFIYKFKNHMDKCLNTHESLDNFSYFGVHHGKKSKLFEFLFPSLPSINSLLATFYITCPNFILIFIPHNVNAFFLNILVSFAVGGLLGDVFLHLFPQIFFGEESSSGLNLVLLDKQKNVILCSFVLSGFIIFMLIDKIMRLFLKHSPDHHKNDHKKNDEATAVSTSLSLRSNGSGDVKKRIVASENKNKNKPEHSVPSVVNTSEVIFFGYLNLIADFFHNFTDGLALFTSFYISPVIGATTTMAIFFHEIPHEIGDFAILMRCGFTKYQALKCQFMTAIGAFFGTLIGIFIHGFSENIFNDKIYFFDASVTINDIILSFVSGTFLYVGTVGIIPQLLATKDQSYKLLKALVESTAVVLGFVSMTII